MITDMINKIVEGIIQVEQKLSTIINCYMGKEDFFLQKGIYRKQRLIDQILKADKTYCEDGKINVNET